MTPTQHQAFSRALRALRLTAKKPGEPAPSPEAQQAVANIAALTLAGAA